jgi:hypothetical protein
MFDLAPGKAGSCGTGSSALMRHSMLAPLRLMSRWVKGERFAGMAISIWQRIKSMPVTISVTGCSTWMRVLTSMK